jgi:Domain of unknown function (DUF6475)
MKTAYQNFYRNQATFKGVNEEEIFEMQREIWQRSFAEYSYRDVMTAFEIWLTTEPFPPTVAELRRTVSKVKNPELFISAEKAWEQVATAVRKFGWCNESLALETLSSNAKRAIQNIGGWQKLCAANEKEWDFRRKDFLEIYGEFEQEAQEQKLIPEHVIKRIQEETHLREQRIEAKLKHISESKTNDLS